MPSKKLILGLAAVAALIFTASSATKPNPQRHGNSSFHFYTTAPGGPAGQVSPSWPKTILFCQTNMYPESFNPHSQAAYLVPRDDLSTGWSDSRFNWWNTYTGWITRRGQIDGHYTYLDSTLPTLSEIFTIAACRWGINEDLLRAVAVKETDWYEHGGPFNAWGDNCLPQHPDPNQGYGSYGIMQVKHFSCTTDQDGKGSWGGFPRTWYSAPFNVDFYGAAFRSCLEQLFWYSIPAGDSNATREKGCVGAWFIGHYDPNQQYVTDVYNHLAAKTWLTY